MSKISKVEIKRDGGGDYYYLKFLEEKRKGSSPGF